MFHGNFFTILLEVPIIVSPHDRVKVPPKPADTGVEPAKNPHCPAEDFEAILLHAGVPTLDVSSSVEDNPGIGKEGHELMTKYVGWPICDGFKNCQGQRRSRWTSIDRQMHGLMNS